MKCALLDSNVRSDRSWVDRSLDAPGPSHGNYPHSRPGFQWTEWHASDGPCGSRVLVPAPQRGLVLCKRGRGDLVAKEAAASRSLNTWRQGGTYFPEAWFRSRVRMTDHPPRPRRLSLRRPSLMTSQSQDVLDSLPLLGGASYADKSSAGDVARVRDHPRSVRERADSSLPYWALSVDAIHRKCGPLQRTSAAAKCRLRLKRLFLR